MKKIRILTLASVVTIFMATVSVVYGGLNWTGIDPIVNMPDGSIVNIDVGVQDWCEVSGDVLVKIHAPAGSSLGAVEPGQCGVSIIPDLKSRGNNDKVRVQVIADGARGVGLEVLLTHTELDGDIETEHCTGVLNRNLNCKMDVDLDN